MTDGSDQRDKHPSGAGGRWRPSRPVLLAVGAAVVVVAAVVLVLVLSSRPTSPGPVTFRAGLAQTAADPTDYCDVDVTRCDQDDAVVRMPVPAGTGLAITVPPGVGATPWQVAFRYRDAAGIEQDGRSPVFPPGARSLFTLALPDPRDQLLTAEVQQYGKRVQNTPQGATFSTRSTWVLLALP